MSFLIRSFAPLRTSSRALSRSTASFSTSPYRSALSENDRDDPDRDAKIDHHKDDSVNRAKSGKGEWKPELASQSEQSVQSEKSNLSMEEMQKMGEAKANEGKSPSGSSSS